MNLHKSSRYGLYAVVMMADQPDSLITASLVAKTFDISENHVAKVLQQLARARIIKSVRGVGGGYQLADDPRKITMADVVEVLQGPLSPKGNAEVSAHFASGAIQSVLEEIEENAFYTLKSITIATLTEHRAKAAAS